MTTLPAEQAAAGRRPRRWLIAGGWLIVSGIAALGLLGLQGVIGAEVLAVVMLAPAVGAGACWLVWRERTTPRLPRASGRAWLASVLLAVAYGAIAAVIMRVSSLDVTVDWHAALRPLGVPAIVFVLAQVAGALGEEVGFRGVLLHNLSERVHPAAAVVITGVLFGLWHVQYYPLGALTMIMFVAGTTGLTAAAAAVMAGTLWQRLVPAVIMHAALNLAGTLTGADLRWFAVAAVVAAVVIVPIGLVLRRRSPEPAGGA